VNEGNSHPVVVLASILRGDDRGVLHDTGNATELADAAIEQGVECLVWQALDRTSGSSALLRSALDSRIRAAAAREFFVRRELVATLRTLESAGIRALLLKGIALGYSIYEQPWHRPTIDTDILVSADGFAAAEQALLDSGYQRSNAVTSGEFVSHQASLERTDASGLQHVIDLHWKIFNPQLVAGMLSFEDLWSDAIPVPLLGGAARMPALVKSLILASAHRLVHHQGHDRLIWLYDIGLLASRLDDKGWRSLADLAAEREVAGLCLDGLQSARDCFGSPLPASVEEALAAAAPRETSRRYLEGRVNRWHVLASDLAALRSWRDRLQLLREHAFPPAAFIRERYGVKSSLWLPALYVHRLLTGAHKWVKP
jgi:hypothetical protein